MWTPKPSQLPRSQFPNSLASRQPIPWSAPLPPIISPLLASPQIAYKALSPLDPHIFDAPVPYPERATAPIRPIQFAHMGPMLRREDTKFHPYMALNDIIYMKYAWIPSQNVMVGRLIYGELAQGPPGSCHGGTLFAVMDDMVGVTGVVYGMQISLDAVVKEEELTWRAGEEKLFQQGKTHRFLDWALDALESSDQQGANIASDLGYSDKDLESLKASRGKMPPYTADEARFILGLVGEKVRASPGVPSCLVSGMSGKLRKRTPLLTDLIVVSKVVERKGRRAKIQVQILSNGGRETAWEPEVFGGDYGTVHAEAEGEAVILWARDVPKEAKI